MKNRWIVLAASVITGMILGGLYAWSVFAPPLRDEYKFTTGQTGLIFGIAVGAFTIAMIAAGRLLDRKGPRITALIGAVLYMLGYFIASYANGSFIILMIGIGVVAGAGIGFSYVCPLATSMKWFPKHKGLVSGIAVAGFGGGAAIFSKVFAAMLAGGMDVFEVFRYIAIIPGSILFLMALLLVNPESVAKKSAAREKLKIKEIICTKRFLALFTGMFAGTFGGLLVIGNLKPMGLSLGISAEAATLSIAVFALGNAAGRILWGYAQDRIGKMVIPLSLIFLGIGVLPYLIRGSALTFFLASVLTGLSFGACFVLYAARVAAWFGIESFGAVYPLVFLSYGISGIIGPFIGGRIFDLAGSYSIPVFICFGLSITGAVAVLYLDRLRTHS